jgi:HD-GYP domain-containing protein (c-di-GMP phosphodiesterase class II)/DNA-binding CsgD family transcriptional regulator
MSDGTWQTFRRYSCYAHCPQASAVKEKLAMKIPVSDALVALAFMGDLSMGQPADHSRRVAWLAQRAGMELGLDAEACQCIYQTAVLRWVGCTANANDVSAAISDDVLGRAAMLALRPEAMGVLISPSKVARHVQEFSAIHCEISVIIAKDLGLGAGVCAALGCLFETWDGNGYPCGIRGDEIPLAVLLVVLCGDIEILSREYGVARAQAFLQLRANAVYPSRLVSFVSTRIQPWLDELNSQGDLMRPAGFLPVDTVVDFSLLADAIDLKLPWLSGHSRRVATLAGSVAAHSGMPVAAQTSVVRAALLHGMGRVAIPNAVWNRAGPLNNADWERVRLSPYWTARVAGQIRTLELEADIASHAYERLDGSGYYRAARNAATSQAHRVLPVVTTWLALLSPRPWRAAMGHDAAIDHLHRQTSLGRFDAKVTDALLGLTATGATPAFGLGVNSAAPEPRPAAGILTARECEVLRCISQGQSNKEAARVLGVSPSTVRAHCENVFRKLGCKSRAAATLKASRLGLL